MKFNLSRKSILIVENYPAMRKSIKDMLYTLGAQYIYEAENAYSALASMKNQKIDIVLCDYNLGKGQNGQQLLEEAKYRNLLSYRAIFIIVTAHNTANFVLNTLESKPDEYLTKPFNPHQLLRRIEKSHARKQNLSLIEHEINRGNLSRAISFCEQLLSSDNKPIHSQLLKLRAELAIKVGEFDEAKQIYQDTLEQRELLWARLGLGVIAYYTNNFPQAITLFQQLIEQHPMLLESYDWLAKTYEATEQHEKAEEILSQATEISPNSFFRQKKLAKIASKLGHQELAEKASKIIIDLGQYSIYKSPCDYSNLAKVYSKSSHNQEALSTLKKMRQLYQNKPEAELRALTIETEIFNKTNETKLSHQTFQKILSLQKQLETQPPKDLQVDIAKACYINNEDKLANKIINTLIPSHIDDNEFIDDIRRMHTEVGKENHSEKLIEKTKKALIDTNNKGVSLFKKGKLKEALAVFEKAVEKMPGNKTIILNMAKIILHDLKSSGFSEENLQLASHYINIAKEIGVEDNKVANLQIEFDKLSQNIGLK